MFPRLAFDDADRASHYVAMSEDALMAGLQARLAAPHVRAYLAELSERLLRELRSDRDEPKSTFGSVPIELYGDLPDDIRSSWVFALRGGRAHPPERHPNSIQRMFALGTPGRFEWWNGTGWADRLLVPGDEGLSIPADVWHRMPAQDHEWVVVSFHTAAPDELVEIVGDPETGTVGSSRAYLASN